MASSFNTTKLNSSTGAKLHLYEMKANQSSPKAIVQINHGMAEHAKRYERFAAALCANGYHVFAHDHRGHGNTVAKDAPQGVFAKQDGLNKVVEDVRSVNAHIKLQYPSTPIAMIGHSMGSIITLNYCIKHSETINAAGLFNSGTETGPQLFIFKTLLQIAKAMKGSDVPSLLATKLTFDDWNKRFSPNRTNFDWLSSDEAEVDKYVKDPHCGFPVSNGLWLEIIKGILIGADNDQLGEIRKELPFYLLGGDQDPCTKNGLVMQRLANRLSKTGIKNVSNKLLQDTRHESLNEFNRDQTTKDIIKWLDKNLA